MPLALLPNRAFLRLSGDDTLNFLQGLVTKDVLRLPQEGVQYAAMLTPQGKFLHDFFLLYWQGMVWIDVERERLPELAQRLKMYRLRSKVEIVADESMSVAVCWGALPPVAEGVLAVADPRFAALGWRLAGRQAELAAMSSATAEDYDAMRLEAGVPDGAKDLRADKSFPLQFGFEALHAVDFSKGCYVGQEVTARTKHLGVLRKLLYRVTALDGSPLPASGTILYAGDEVAGEMCSSAGASGLALLQVAVADKAAQGLRYDSSVGGGRVSAVLPSWLSRTLAA
jgi:hypothetical protein